MRKGQDQRGTGNSAKSCSNKKLDKDLPQFVMKEVHDNNFIIIMTSGKVMVQFVMVLHLSCLVSFLSHTERYRQSEETPFVHIMRMQMHLCMNCHVVIGV